ncbi:MAG: GDP-mannose 4,6-dehydratase [Gemmatimonadaceae bacterium]|nr:GDP-mannose 4,6-dehydratase [Gemmatimonadaceae bacterium]
MSFWNQKRVFVTGATGLLGSHMTAELLRRGADVVCLVRDWVPDSESVTSGSLSRCRLVRGDLEDYLLVLRALNEYEIDTIFHLGAQTIVGTASRSPLSTFEANIKGTWVLLEAARQMTRVERVLVASSDKAYGEHDRLPYTEDAALVGKYPYDVSKSCADLIALSYFHSFRLPVAVTRCGNLYGGGDLNFNRLVPGTIRSALRGEAPVIRSDGTFVRDYFYVRDAVQAYLALAERMPDDGFTGEAFNFGTETPLSVIAMATKVLEVMNQSALPLTILNQASNEIPKQYLDCTKARRRLGWEPRWTLEESLSDTVAWYREWMARGQRGLAATEQPAAVR